MDNCMITLHRVVPKGCANPNTGKVYNNMEQQISDAIARYDGRLPVTKRAEDAGCTAEERMIQIRAEDIVGHIVSVSDTEATMELNLSGIEMLQRGSLADKFVQFVHLAERENPDKVAKVLWAELARAYRCPPAEAVPV